MSQLNAKQYSMYWQLTVACDTNYALVSAENMSICCLSLLFQKIYTRSCDRDIVAVIVHVFIKQMKLHSYFSKSKSFLSLISYLGFQNTIIMS